MSPEDRLQVSVVQWLKLALPADALFYAVPNGGSRNPIEGAKLKAMGTLPGVSDLNIECNGRTYHIELKTASGRQSPAQKAFESSVHKAGNLYQLCRSLDEVEGALLGWGFRLSARCAA